MNDEPGQGQTSFRSGEGLLLIAGFCTVSAFFIVIMVLAAKLNPATSLPSLSIIGIAVLLICLAAISYVFVRVNLQDRTQALGLPQGSIQAVIALSLIVLFAILSIYVFASMNETPLRKLTGLDEAGRKEQVEKLGTTFAGWEKDDKSNTFTIFVREPSVDARNDIGKQLIVLIGTLMTSAVSFYFGSRATLAAAQPSTEGGASKGGEPKIGEIEPREIQRGETASITITGTDLGQTAAVVFQRDGSPSLTATVKSAGDTVVTCSIAVPIDATPGDYDAVLTVAGARIVKLKALTLVG